MSDLNIATSGLDSILLKPFEEQIKSTFNGRKSLALLHSWDEIVYKDINRIFAFQQFDKKYRWICQNEKILFQTLKAIKSSPSLYNKYHQNKNRSSSINKLPSNSKSPSISTSNLTPKPVSIETKQTQQIRSTLKPKSSVNVITSNNVNMNNNNEIKSIPANHSKVIEPKSNSINLNSSSNTNKLTPMVTIKQSVTSTTATTTTPTPSQNNMNNMNMSYAQDQNQNQNQFNINKQNQLNQQYAQYAQYAQYNNNRNNMNRKKSVNANSNNYYAQYAQYAQFGQAQQNQNQQKYVQNMNMNKTSNNTNNYYAQYAQYNNMNMNKTKKNTNNYAQYAQYAQYANNNNKKSMTNMTVNVNVNQNMNMNMNMNMKMKTNANNINMNNNKKEMKQGRNAQFYNHTYYDASIQSSYQIKNGCYYYNPLNINNNNNEYGEITEMVVGDENSQSSQGNISALSNTMDNSSSASLSNVTDSV